LVVTRADMQPLVNSDTATQRNIMDFMPRIIAPPRSKSFSIIESHKFSPPDQPVKENQSCIIFSASTGRRLFRPEDIVENNLVSFQHD
jgi:hypothetical protein